MVVNCSVCGIGIRKSTVGRPRKMCRMCAKITNRDRARDNYRIKELKRLWTSMKLHRELYLTILGRISKKCLKWGIRPSDVSI